MDTDVISESRKAARSNPGVQVFFDSAIDENLPLFLSVVTIGELRQGVERIRHRGDVKQAKLLERWLGRVTTEFANVIIPFDEDAAHIWGRLRVPHAENPLDKQIAATALLHDLTVVTRNTAHYAATGVRLVNPFS